MSLTYMFPLQIAIEGCSHGCLDQIYSSILSLDRKVAKKTSLLLLCGDVQTLRNAGDMHSLAVPQKHKRMGDFHRYYSGERRAPILTIMIGGNHEASNYLWELYHGGWVAPNIYYLGAAGCVDVGGLTIAGISGIYKSHDYPLGRFEQMPYTPSTVRSIYHTRRFDTFRLHMLSKSAAHKPEIVMSHDWPNTIEQRGDVNWLKKRKSFFIDEINTSSLGSPPLWQLLQDLQPKYWFSAHLHVRFAALVKHSGQATQVKGGQKSRIVKAAAAETPDQPLEDSIDESVETKAGNNTEEMAIDMSDAEDEDIIGTTGNPEQIDIKDNDFDEDPIYAHDHDVHQPGVDDQEEKTMEIGSGIGSTRFLALSKCLEGQDFLQILEVLAPFDTDDKFKRDIKMEKNDGEISTITQPSFQFNSTWLAITRATHEYLSLEKRQKDLPKVDSFVSQVKEQEEWVKTRLSSIKGDHISPLDIENTQHFVKTAPATNDANGRMSGPPPWYTNPQTVALCSFLDIKNRINPPPAILPSFATTGMLNDQRDQLRPTILSEEEEIRRIEEVAQNAMKKKKLQGSQTDGEEIEPVTLLDEDESAARWKEGTG